MNQFRFHFKRKSHLNSFSANNYCRLSFNKSIILHISLEKENVGRNIYNQYYDEVFFKSQIKIHCHFMIKVKFFRDVTIGLYIDLPCKVLPKAK